MYGHLLEAYKPTSLKQIEDDFRLSDGQYQSLINMAMKSGVKVNSASTKVARAAINNDLKASLARVYFDDEAYYKVQNSSDKAITRSLQELKQP
jgi:hypothetical protein